MDKLYKHLKENWLKLEQTDSLTKETLLNYIQKFSGCQTSGGNCGQWAFGLAKFLNEKYNENLKLGMITNELEDITDIEQMLHFEPDIYHVFLDWNDTWFDETGQIDEEYLLNLASDQYDDKSPDLWTDMEIDETTRKIISFNTNWNQEWLDFYKKAKQM